MAVEQALKFVPIWRHACAGVDNQLKIRQQVPKRLAADLHAAFQQQDDPGRNAGDDADAIITQQQFCHGLKFLIPGRADISALGSTKGAR